MNTTTSKTQRSAKPTILVLFAHLAIEDSKINHAMIEAIRGLDHVIIHDLLETYPDFYIDVEAERQLLLTADLIVFHHPIYWYSSPAIFKHWQDVVLTRGFAYGDGGTALRNKDFMLAISTGAPVHAYQVAGVHRFPIDELLLPLLQMANYCGMNYLKPLLIQGGHSLPQQAIDEHAQKYRRLLSDYTPNNQ